MLATLVGVIELVGTLVATLVGVIKLVGNLVGVIELVVALFDMSQDEISPVNVDAP